MKTASLSLWTTRLGRGACTVVVIACSLANFNRVTVGRALGHSRPSDDISVGRKSNGEDRWSVPSLTLRRRSTNYISSDLLFFDALTSAKLPMETYQSWVW